MKLAATKQPKTVNDFASLYGSHGSTVAQTQRFQEFRRMVSLIPWLTITATDNGWIFEVDYELKQLCDDYRPGTVGAFSLIDHLRNLRKEIRRVREEQKCERKRKVWNSSSTDAVQLKLLLDYIEQQLDAIPTTRKTQKPVVLPNRAHGAAQESDYDQEAGRTDTGIDDGTGEVVSNDEAPARRAGIETIPH